MVTRVLIVLFVLVCCGFSFFAICFGFSKLFFIIREGVKRSK